MRGYLTALLGSVLVAVFLCTAEPVKVAQAEDKPQTKPAVSKLLQDVSVTIRANNAEGSGVIKTTKDGSTWILTAAHVVEDCRKLQHTLDTTTGSVKHVIVFDDPKVIKIYVEEGRIVGRNELDAEVIRYSSIDQGHDLALLRLRTKKLKPESSIVFYNSDTIPDLGTELYHCGSLLGQFGSNSLTSGIMSQHGRLIDNLVYDQTTCTAFPGSSGGPVCLKADGRYVGMLTRGAGEGFNLIVPVRRIKQWAKQSNVEFVLDDTKAVPSDEELKKLPVDTGSLSSQPKTSSGDKKHYRPLVFLHQSP